MPQTIVKVIVAVSVSLGVIGCGGGTTQTSQPAPAIDPVEQSKQKEAMEKYYGGQGKLPSSGAPAKR